MLLKNGFPNKGRGMRQRKRTDCHPGEKFKKRIAQEHQRGCNTGWKVSIEINSEHSVLIQC